MSESNTPTGVPLPDLGYPKADPAERINHVRHYQGDLVMTLIEQADLNFATGNAFKYILRAGLKEPADYDTDLKKAAWYFRRQFLGRGLETQPIPFECFSIVSIYHDIQLPRRSDENRDEQLALFEEALVLALDNDCVTEKNVIDFSNLLKA